MTKTDCSECIWNGSHGLEKPIKCVGESVVSKGQPRLGIDDSYTAMTKTTIGENSSQYKTPQKETRGD